MDSVYEVISKLPVLVYGSLQMFPGEWRNRDLDIVDVSDEGARWVLHSPTQVLQYLVGLLASTRGRKYKCGILFDPDKGWTVWICPRNGGHEGDASTTRPTRS